MVRRAAARVFARSDAPRFDTGGVVDVAVLPSQQYPVRPLPGPRNVMTSGTRVFVVGRNGGFFEHPFPRFSPSL